MIHLWAHLALRTFLTWLLQWVEIELMVQVLCPIIQRFICIFVRYPEGNIYIYWGEQAMPLSYKSLGRYLEGNIVIYDLHSDYLLIFNFYLVFWIFSCDIMLSIQDFWWLIFLNLGHIACSTQLILNYKSLNCISWDVNCIKHIYCICSLWMEGCFLILRPLI